ncbi:MAG: hypothetical protein HC848_02525 [Limnobacter sp.]|nr:hypothetical protein [Limnobacter sp.]
MRGTHIQVGPLKNRTLKLFVGTPSNLARIRQSLPSMIHFLQTKGLDIAEITLKIQSIQANAPPPSPKKGVMPQSAKNVWLELEKQAVEPAIKKAARRLCAHHWAAKNEISEKN